MSSDKMKPNSPQLSDIPRIEVLTKLKLIPDFEKYYMLFSGRHLPDFEYNIKLIYSPNIDENVSLTNFLSFREVEEHWQYIGYLKEFVAHFDLSSENFETEFWVPFINTYDGCIFVSMSGVTKGKLYHADNGDFGIAFVANDIESFLKSVGII